MFCDFCLPEHQDIYVQRDRLAMAVRLGFDAVATEHVAHGRLRPQDRCLSRARTSFHTTLPVPPQTSLQPEAFQAQDKARTKLRELRCLDVGVNWDS